MIKNLEIYDRIFDEAQFVIETKATIRQTASNFGLSKSTVHNDLRKVLPTISHSLTIQVNEVLEENKALRHIRSGETTRCKYLK